MDGPLLALILTTVIHLIGIVALLSVLGADIREAFRSPDREWGSDGGEPPADEPFSPVAGGGSSLPLPDAEQSPVRLREPGRIGAKRRRERRRVVEPERTPQRETV